MVHGTNQNFAKELHSMNWERALLDSFQKKSTSAFVYDYSTPRGKTDKLEEPVNREPNVTRSWNFIQLICIFYDFKAPPLENR